MKVQVAVSSTSFAKSPSLRKKLEQTIGNRAEILYVDPQKGELKGHHLISFLNQAQFAIVGKEPIDAETLSQLPTLRGISKYGVGLDNIDFEACERNQVSVSYKAGVNRYQVAELTVGLLLALQRKICLNHQRLQTGKWIKEGGTSLFGKTVGIVGCGAIGSCVAKILKALGCNLLLCDLLDKSALASELGGKTTSFSGLLPRADIVTFHVPLTSETFHMLDDQGFKAMKSSSTIINTSRGSVICEDHLVNAIQEKRIAGAALDVFEQEPLPSQSPLRDMEQVVLSPHSAGGSTDAVEAMGQAAIDSLKKWF